MYGCACVLIWVSSALSSDGIELPTHGEAGIDLAALQNNSSLSAKVSSGQFALVHGMHPEAPTCGACFMYLINQHKYTSHDMRVSTHTYIHIC